MTGIIRTYHAAMKLIFFLFFLLIKWQQVDCQCFPSSGVPAPTTLTDTAGTIDRYGVGFTSSNTCQWILTPPSFSDFLLYIDVTRLGTTRQSECTTAGLILPDGSAQCSDPAQFTRTCFLYSHLSIASSCQDDVTTRTCGNASVLAANQWPPSIRFVVGFVVLDAGFTLNYTFINCTAAVTSAFATTTATTEPTTSLEPTTTTSLEQSTSASTLLESSPATPMPTITQENSNPTTAGLTISTTTNDPGDMPQFSLPIYFYPPIGGAVLLLLIFIIFIVLMRKRRNRFAKENANQERRSVVCAITDNRTSVQAYYVTDRSHQYEDIRDADYAVVNDNRDYVMPIPTTIPTYHDVINKNPYLAPLPIPAPKYEQWQ